MFIVNLKKKFDKVMCEISKINYFLNNQEASKRIQLFQNGNIKYSFYQYNFTSHSYEYLKAGDFNKSSSLASFGGLYNYIQNCTY